MIRLDDERREILGSDQINFLRPQDRGITTKIKDGAWHGLAVPEEASHTWDALMSDNPVSLSYEDNGEILGYSFNFLKFMHEEIVLWVHMIGVVPEHQNLNIGKLLMQGNFNLIEKSKLGEQVNTVGLTSDPLVSRNMYFFLHKCGMYTKNYVVDAYSGEGRSIPSDRLVFMKHPKISKPVNYPTLEEYKRVYGKFSQAFLDFGRDSDSINPVGLSLVFVETPSESSHADKLGLDGGIAWREFHRRLLPNLFQQGYTAVDLVRGDFSEKPKSYIVLQKGFDETDSNTISKAVENSI